MVATTGPGADVVEAHADATTISETGTMRRRTAGPRNSVLIMRIVLIIAKVSVSIAEYLRGRGVRWTRARRVVVEALQRASGPRSAAELGEELTEPVPQSSLYRTLAVLVAAGVVAEHHGAAGTTRFELAEWITGHHHHLVCDTCGRVRDLVLEPEEESTLEDLVTRVGQRVGARARGHALEIVDRCQECR